MSKEPLKKDRLRGLEITFASSGHGYKPDEVKIKTESFGHISETKFNAYYLSPEITALLDRLCQIVNNGY